MLKNTTCVAFNVCRLEVTRLQETEETVLKDSAERFIKLLDCATHLSKEIGLAVFGTVHVCCFMLVCASTKTFVSRIHIR